MRTSSFKLSLHPAQFEQKPEDPKVIGRISRELGRFPVEVTLDELSIAIGRGQTYCIGTFHNGSRKIENFVQAQIVGLDIDRGNLTSQDILNRLSHCGVTPNLIGETFSSKPGDLKWRVLIGLSEALEDPSTYSQVTKYLIRAVGGDKATSDPSRLFFGSQTKPEAITLEPNSTSQLVSRAQAFFKDNPLVSQPVVGDVEINPGSDTDRFEASRVQCFNWMFQNLERGDRELVMLIDKDCMLAMSNPVEVYGSGYATLWNVSRKLAQCSAFSSEYIYLFISHWVEECFDEWVGCKHLDRVDEIVSNGVEFGRDTLRF